MRSKLRRRPVFFAVAATVLVAVVVAGYWFAPWKLFTNKQVDEALPAVPGPVSASADPTPSPGPTQSPAVRLLAQGSFISHEHQTSGTVQLVQLPDQRRQLIFRDLSTSDGPDVWVWLSDQPVRADEATWSSFTSGHYVALAPLKGNRGNQVYEVPATADLTTLHSVSLWCRRFAVSFGAAELIPS
jgi:hypothetical protein